MILGQAASLFTQLLGASGLWDGIGQKLQSVFLGLKSTLLLVFADVMESLPPLLGGGAGKGNALRGSALIAEGEAGLASNAGDRAFGNIDVKGLVSSMAEAFKATGGAFADGYAGAGQAIPTADLEKQLGSLIGAVSAKADAFFAKQNGQTADTQATAATARNTEGILKTADGMVSGLRLIQTRLEDLALSGGVMI